MFRDLVEISNDIIIVTDRGFRILYISPSAAKIFGIKSDQINGLSLFKLIRPQKIDHWRAALLDYAYSFQEEISLKTSENQKMYFDVQVFNLPGKDSNMRSLAFRLHDITPKKIRESELVTSNQQLDQVIYKTTHDLRAPLMSVVGLINLAEKATEQERMQYLELIRKTVQRMDSLIDEMNNFFRNDKLALKCVRIDMAQLIQEEIAYLRNLHDAYKMDIQFYVEGSTDFYSDIVRMKTIITNLLSNAIKYSDPKKSDPFIKISVSIKGEICELRFTDNGIGIDPKYQDKIFELFFRATTHSQGTGLGLFIVKDTIEKLKGTIEVSSIQDQGTTFMILVPNQIFQPIVVG